MSDIRHLMDASSEERDQSFRNRVIIVAGIGVFFVFLVLARLINVQIVNFEKYSTVSDENRIKVKAIPAPRGFFFDRDGRVLADMKFILTLSIDEQRVENLDATIARLREILDLTDQHIKEFERQRRTQSRPFRPVPIKRNITYEESAYIALNRHLFPGVIVQSESIRNYPFGELTSHALGTVRRITQDDLATLDPTIYSVTDFVGGTGIEKFYESDLAGTPGHRIVEVDAHHREIRVLNETAPIHGSDVFLHLDMDLQQVAWDALGERRGAVIALETQSGGIMAMVSKPGYDPNLFVQGISEEDYAALQDPIQSPLFNRATRATYAPGSTFKPVVALAALSTGTTTWERIIWDGGEFRLKNTRNSRVWRGWSWTKTNPGGQGECDLFRAIYRSSNIYFYTVAEEMGIEQLAGFARQFGFGRNEVFDVPEAEEGLLPDPDWKRDYLGERWQPGDTVNLGIGQGSILATPMQVVQVAATIASNGQRRQPRMIYYSPKQLKATEVPPKELPPVHGILPEDWQLLKDSMKAVIHRGNMGYGQNGTAWAYIGIDIPYEMSGKSGTAQTIAIPPGEEYEEDEVPEKYRDHAWFMAYAPADQPEVAVVVLIENGGGGSSQAGPVARAVLDEYMKGKSDSDDA